MKTLWLLALGIGLTGAALLVGCRARAPEGPEATEPPWFEDVAAEVGLNFVHDAGPVDGNYFMPAIVGSGAAFFDFDGDGLLDIYLLNNGGPNGRPNQLFKQMPDGTFKDVSKGSGLDFSGHCMGVAIGDVNNDGHPDVLVTESPSPRGRGRIRLFLNNGNGTFTDVTREAGLYNPLWGVSAAFVDYDRDGWLDLIVVNSVDYDDSWACSAANGTRDFCSPKPFPGTVSRLFRNLGKELAASKAATPKGVPPPVRFKDVSFESGIGRLPAPGLGVICADFDGDGWPDIFIANDGKPNHLWINQKDGTFKEEAVLRGVAVNAMGQPEANMGIGWGDVDGDGLQDVFVTHLNSETNTVWKQGPRGLFKDVTAASGMARPVWRGTGFGTMLADFNHDGALDAVVANGGVSKQPPIPGSELGSFWSMYAERNQLFVGDGKGRFRDLSPFNKGRKGLAERANIGRGLAIGDVRNDGTLWVLVTGVAGPVQLYRNVAPKQGHWLVVRAYDAALKRDALGAEVTVRAGGRTFVRTAQSGGSYLCSNDPRAHFGLGPAERVDSIEVSWPDGSKERFEGGAVDRPVLLTRGQGKPVE
jgi:hypothetical protein